MKRACAIAIVVVTSACGTSTSPTRSEGSSDPVKGPPGSVHGPASAEDAARDLVDEADTPVEGPRYVDIHSLRANVAGDSLRIRLRLGGRIPSVDAAVEEITYLVQIDTDAAEDVDYWLTAENRSSRRFAAVLTDWAANDQSDTDSGDFPGGLVVEGRTVTWRVPLAELGDPSSIRLSVEAQQFIDVVTAWDYLPDAAAELSADDEDWIVVVP